MSVNCLFTYQNKCIGADDFIRTLHDVGVKTGDAIFVHSDIGAFGKLGPDYAREKVCRGIIGALQESAGENGTIAMPTFTYAFCRSGLHDRQKSPSEVGALTEFFRHEPEVTRSKQPIFSIAAWGAERPSLMNVDMDAFGPDSFLAKLVSMNASIIFLGTSFEKACTLAHHVEQMHNVPYRFMKEFSGVIRYNGKEEKTQSTFFVRPLDGTVINDFSRLAALLRRKGFLKEVQLGAGRVSVAKAQDIFREGMGLLDENIYVLLKDGQKKFGK
ncbi:MAG: aminoglycoside N3'-acetyltransferase [Parcubacteria group bacterium Gr01-1014_66]|nr:MAG: aminoglycoside N3'-acetyltransferase [Parcubacteria group bacterium Gr01-1014_66]